MLRFNTPAVQNDSADEEQVVGSTNKQLILRMERVLKYYEWFRGEESSELDYISAQLTNT